MSLVRTCIIGPDHKRRLNMPLSVTDLVHGTTHVLVLGAVLSLFFPAILPLEC